MNRPLVFIAAFLADLLVIHPGEAHQAQWEESCRIHEIIQAQQDAEHLKAVEERLDPQLRKKILKEEESFESDLRERLEQANLIIHVRNLSRCVDGFVEQIPASIELRISEFV